ncbi:MAG TPA: ISAs1 family transposase [Blastococcus sp.]
MASSPARASSDQAPVALPADLPTHLTATLIDDLAAGRMASMSSLAAALAAVPDARHRRGRRHELTGVLAIAACACLTGARSYVAIGEWAAAQGAAVLDCLADGPEQTAVPCETTVRRCLQATDAPALDAAVAGWAGGRLAAQQAIAAGAGHRPVAPVNAGRRVIAIDGKTLRGSAPRTTAEQVAVARRGGGRTHLVAAYDHASGVTLGQLGCAPEAGKAGEVATAMALAATLDERRLLAGSVITVDAGFTARELAADLRARGAHWILRVKGNQKRLHARLTALPWAQVPEAARVRSVGHGRVETRTIRVIDLAGSDDGHGEFFPDAAQALKIVRRRRTRRGRWSVQTVYAITSLDAREADPALLACWVRGHWRIEGGLHWVRDVVFAEDHSQVRTAYGPVNLAVLRTLAINALRLTDHTNIAAGLRQHARTPLLPLATLGLM